MILRPTWRDRPGTLPDRLAAELRDQIAIGHIGPGSPLPSERRLATDANVSRTTVAAAVALLVSSGWASRRDRARAVARLPTVTGQALAPEHPGSGLDLMAATTAAPVELLDAAIDRARSRITPRLLGDGREPRGLGELRHVVAERFTTAGLATTADELLITNGAMGAFASVLDATPGRVLVEDPTYHIALQILAARRRSVVTWPRLAGWDVPGLDHVVRRRSPALAYLVPDFHNPTGALADDGEREALAGLDERIDTVIVDETLRDLDLRRTGADRRRLPAHLASVLTRAVTIGGLSKTVWSGLRLGWLRDVDDRRRAELVRHTQVQPPPVLDQLIALELWPSLDEIIEARQRRLRRQRDALCQLLDAAGLAVARPPGGLVVWVDLGRPCARELTERMACHDVVLAPGGLFSAAHPTDRFLRLPFTHDPATVATGVELLVATLAEI